MMVNTKYEILTPTGFKKFKGINNRIKDEYLTIFLSNGKNIKCSLDHIFIQHNKEIFAHELNIFDKIDSNGNEIHVIDIEYNKSSIELFDIIGVEDNHLYITNDVVSHNCDTDFISSGNSVIEPSILEFYRQTYCQPPIEKTGFDSNLWRWEYPDYTKSYIVVADVSRGDGADYSACHVFDIQNLTQVAEYKGKISTKDYGNFLVTLATEYNEALLVVENANVGWAVIQQIIDREYKNLFYMSKDLKYVDVQHQLNNRYRAEERGMIAGFSTTAKTRPLIIAKFEQYIREKDVVLRSTRLIDELYTFIWNGSRAEAMSGYHDDLVMSLGIALWVRDTAIRLRQEGIDLTRKTLGGITQYSVGATGFIGNTSMNDNPWNMKIGDIDEDISWLIN